MKLSKHIYCSLLLGFCTFVAFGQVNPQNITIVRDSFGVPHIYGKTDAEVAYGLAWATAEDDFKSMQENILSIRGRLGEIKGVDGAIFDFLAFAIGTKEVVEAKYETDISDDFKAVLQGYTAGVNAYAARHEDELLLKDIFPISEKDVLQGYVLNLTLLSSVHEDITKIINRNIKRYELPQGSNGIAMNHHRTKDGNTYLAVNSHQPLEGPFAWYEAHLESEEGWQMIGANFPGGVSLFIGTTPNLGWTHTVNHPDFDDVYKLEMHPKDKLKYKLDGNWETLTTRTFKSKVKIGFLKIPFKKKIYESKYGLTLKNKDGFYSIRFQGNMATVKAAEQWYRMNKAQDFKDFKAALDVQGIGCTNIVYADKESNIYYLGNGNFPKRNPNYDWKKVLPGNTSATLWEADFLPIDSLAQVLNPNCGYVFNTNNTPFNATAPAENIDSNDINPTIGYLKWDNNRSLRFQHLIGQYEKLDYEDFKKIKFDQEWQNPAYAFVIRNIEDIFSLDANKYPQIAEVIKILKAWDRKTNIENGGATVFIVALRFLHQPISKEGRSNELNILTEAEFVSALEQTQKYLNKHFGSVYVALGLFQRHTRGDVSLPMSGAPDVLAAIYGIPQKNGQIRVVAGDSYIQLVQYTKNGVVIESVNAYGSSANPKSPHYTDQMELYVKQQLKPMTFDKALIMKNAERIYKPF
jgi:acyl-homoserine-lactone acylase